MTNKENMEENAKIYVPVLEHFMKTMSLNEDKIKRFKALKDSLNDVEKFKKVEGALINLKKNYDSLKNPSDVIVIDSDDEDDDVQFVCSEKHEKDNADFNKEQSGSSQPNIVKIENSNHDMKLKLNTFVDSDLRDNGKLINLTEKDEVKISSGNTGYNLVIVSRENDKRKHLNLNEQKEISQNIKVPVESKTNSLQLNFSNLFEKIDNDSDLSDISENHFGYEESLNEDHLESNRENIKNKPKSLQNEMHKRTKLLQDRTISSSPNPKHSSKFNKNVIPEINTHLDQNRFSDQDQDTFIDLQPSVDDYKALNIELNDEISISNSVKKHKKKWKYRNKNKRKHHSSKNEMPIEKDDSDFVLKIEKNQSQLITSEILQKYESEEVKKHDKKSCESNFMDSKLGIETKKPSSKTFNHEYQNYEDSNLFHRRSKNINGVINNYNIVSLLSEEGTKDIDEQNENSQKIATTLNEVSENCDNINSLLESNLLRERTLPRSVNSDHTKEILKNTHQKYIPSLVSSSNHLDVIRKTEVVKVSENSINTTCNEDINIDNFSSESNKDFLNYFLEGEDISYEKLHELRSSLEKQIGIKLKKEDYEINFGFSVPDIDYQNKMCEEVFRRIKMSTSNIHNSAADNEYSCVQTTVQQSKMHNLRNNYISPRDPRIHSRVIRLYQANYFREEPKDIQQIKVPLPPEGPPLTLEQLPGNFSKEIRASDNDTFSIKNSNSSMTFSEKYIQIKDRRKKAREEMVEITNKNNMASLKANEQKTESSPPLNVQEKKYGNTEKSMSSKEVFENLKKIWKERPDLLENVTKELMNQTNEEKSKGKEISSQIVSPDLFANTDKKQAKKTIGEKSKGKEISSQIVSPDLFAKTDKKQAKKTIGEKSKGKEISSQIVSPDLFANTDKKQAKKTMGEKSKKEEISKKLKKPSIMNELTKLQEDINKSYMRDAISNATGKRKSSEVATKRNKKMLEEDNGDEEIEIKRTKIPQRRKSINCLERKRVFSDSDDSKFNKVAKITKRRKTISAIEDDDEFTEDFTQHKKIKESFQKRDLKLLYLIPKVKLKRIKLNSNRYLLDYNKTNGPTLKVLKEVDISESLQNKNRKITVKNKNITKNTNPLFHFDYKYKNVCIICVESFSSSEIVSHYVNFHSSEVFISRLKRKVVANIKKNHYVAEKLSDSEYRMICLFCEMEIIDSFVKFNDHFCSHTGEFKYKCSECDCKRNSKRDMHKHCKYECEDKNEARVEPNYSFSDHAKVINGYICNMCNYIQLHRANIEKHLKTEHLEEVHDSHILEIKLIERDCMSESNNDITKPIKTEFQKLAVNCEINETSMPKNSNFMTFIHCNSRNVFDSNQTHIKLELDKVTINTNNCIQSNKIETDYVEPHEINAEVKDSNTAQQIKNYDMELDDHSNESENGISVEINQSNTAKQIEGHDVEVGGLSNENVLRLLKPWECHTSSKKSILQCDRMRKTLDCLYKCMGNDCSFATNLKEDMVKHLSLHRDEVIECSYCESSFTSTTLIEHIDKEHSSSFFQCPKCFYRSVTRYSVQIHIDLFHRNESDKIITLSGVTKSSKLEQLEILQYRTKNVKPLECEDCSLKFYIPEFLQNHMKIIHNKNLDQIKIGLFACLYCQFNMEKIEEVREHLANKHPTKLLYVCVRSPKNKIYINNSKNYSSINSTSILFAGELMKMDRLSIKNHKISSNTGKTSSNLEISDMKKLDEFNNSLITLDDISKSLDNNLTQQLPTKSILPNVCKEKINKKNRKQDLAKELDNLIRDAFKKTGLAGKELYMCPKIKCGWTFDYINDWQNHLTLHRNTKTAAEKYSCPHCKITPQRLNISEFPNHFENHMPHKYICYFCGETFLTIDKAKEHMRVKHSVTNIDICSKTTKTKLKYYIILGKHINYSKKSLNRHMIDILRERNYKKKNKNTAEIQSQSSDDRETKPVQLNNKCSNNSEVSIREHSQFIQPEKKSLTSNSVSSKQQKRNSPSHPNFTQNNIEMSSFLSNENQIPSVILDDNILSQQQQKVPLIHATFNQNGVLEASIRMPSVISENNILSQQQQIQSSNNPNLIQNDVFGASSFLSNEIQMPSITSENNILSQQQQIESSIHPNFTQTGVLEASIRMPSVISENNILIQQQQIQSSNNPSSFLSNTSENNILSQQQQKETLIHPNLIQKDVFRASSFLSNEIQMPSVTSENSILSQQQQIESSSIQPNLTQNGDFEASIRMPSVISESNILSQQQQIQSSNNPNLIQNYVFVANSFLSNEIQMQSITSENNILSQQQQIESSSHPNLTQNGVFEASIRMPSVILENNILSHQQQIQSSNNPSSFLSNTSENSILSQQQIQSSSNPNLTQNGVLEASIRMPSSNLTHNEVIEASSLLSNKNKVSSIVAHNTLNQQNVGKIRLVPLNKLLSNTSNNSSTATSFSSNSSLEPSTTLTSISMTSCSTKDACIIYICTSCNYQSSTLENIRRHWNQVCSKKQFPFEFTIGCLLRCLYCEKTGIFDEMKKHHVECHSELFVTRSAYKLNKCAECSFESYSNNIFLELKNHFEVFHRDSLEWNYSSIDCFSSDFINELMERSEKLNSYECTYCQNTYRSEHLCIRHVKEVHLDKVLSYSTFIEDKCLYGCKKCNYLFYTQPEALEHIKILHLPQFGCTFCSKSFHSTNKLLQHYRNVHMCNFETYRYIDEKHKLLYYGELIVLFPNGLAIAINKLKNADSKVYYEFQKNIKTEN